MSVEYLFYPAEGRGDMMDEIERTLSVLDYILDTPKKRHIAGGILLSLSMLFTGLALTVMTIRNETYIEKGEDDE